MNDTPKIRFKDFTDKWEQRKVGDFLTVSRVVGHTGIDARKLTVKLWGKGVVEKTDLYGGSENTQYYIRRAGQFMYGKLDFLHAAFGIVPESLDKYESTLDSPAFDMKNIDGQFFLNRVTQEDFYLKNGMVANGSRKAKRIHEDTFLDMPISVPSFEEQVCIGELLVGLDELITLHQRKYNQMINVKKSMLKKLFPHNGASAPEIRFKEFTGDWKRRKLGDVFEEYCEKCHEELPPLTIIQGKGTILRDEANRNLQYDKSALHNYKMVKKGDFIVHLRSFEGGLEKASSDGIISPAYYAFHGKGTDTRFYYPYFRSHEFINVELSRHVYGIRDGRSIDISGMKTIMIPYTSIEEQRKIGDFLEGLDALTELYQQEFVKLKQIKSACLDGMFI